MGIFSKLNKKIDDGPEIDDVEAWLAGDDEGQDEPKNRSTDVPDDQGASDTVDVAAAIGPLGNTGAPLTASELIAAAPPADMDASAAPEAAAPAMWNMPDIAEPDVQWDAPLPEPDLEPEPDPASSGVTTADLAAMVADSNRAGAKPPELSEPLDFDAQAFQVEPAGEDVTDLAPAESDSTAFEPAPFEPAAFDTAAFDTAAFDPAQPAEPESLVSFDQSETLFDAGDAGDTDPFASGDDVSMPPPPAGEMLAPADASVIPGWSSDIVADTAFDDTAVDDTAFDDTTVDEFPVADAVTAEPVEGDTVADADAISLDDVASMDGVASMEAISFDGAMADETTDSIEPIEVDAPQVAASSSHLASMPQGEQAEVLLEILGLEAGATWTEAREARAALLAEHDPDGETDPDRVALALAIRREMNTAYAALRLLQVP